MNVYTASDHEFTSFQLQEHEVSRRANKRNPASWNLAKLDRRKLVEQLDRIQEAGLTVRLKSTARAKVEFLIDSIMQLIEPACDSSMPRKNLTRVVAKFTGGRT